MTELHTTSDRTIPEIAYTFYLICGWLCPSTDQHRCTCMCHPCLYPMMARKGEGDPTISRCAIVTGHQVNEYFTIKAVGVCSTPGSSRGNQDSNITTHRMSAFCETHSSDLGPCLDQPIICCSSQGWSDLCRKPRGTCLGNTTAQVQYIIWGSLWIQSCPHLARLIAFPVDHSLTPSVTNSLRTIRGRRGCNVLDGTSPGTSCFVTDAWNCPVAH